MKKDYRIYILNRNHSNSCEINSFLSRSRIRLLDIFLEMPKIFGHFVCPHFFRVLAYVYFYRIGGYIIDGIDGSPLLLKLFLENIYCLIYHEEYFLWI